MRKHTFGLCAGRHDIPEVDKYIFGEITDPTDTDALYEEVCDFFMDNEVDFGDNVDIYVTGPTSALIAAIFAAKNLGVYILTLYHYDCKTGKYFKQWTELY